jgi:hypothetical protein
MLNAECVMEETDHGGAKSTEKNTAGSNVEFGRSSEETGSHDNSWSWSVGDGQEATEFSRAWHAASRIGMLPTWPNERSVPITWIEQPLVANATPITSCRCYPLK